MPTCAKCGSPLAFVDRIYRGITKSTPVNPDGTDHWDLCKTIQRRAMGLIRPDGSVDIAKLASLNQRNVRDRRAPSRITHVWDLPVLPIGAAFGDYRDFTKAEKEEGILCRKI